MILLAAGAGLLILLVIFVILWKLGFFKRGDSRYQPEMHRAQKKVFYSGLFGFDKGQFGLQLNFFIPNL